MVPWPHIYKTLSLHLVLHYAPALGSHLHRGLGLITFLDALRARPHSVCTRLLRGPEVPVTQVSQWMYKLDVGQRVQNLRHSEAWVRCTCKVICVFLRVGF